ncbi:MAG: fasciclin domain-containing protein [Candidatus Promineifilaceae bacterium]
MRHVLKLAALIVLLAAVLNSRSVVGQDTNTLLDVLRQQDQMTTFVSLVDAAELGTMLSNPGGFTVFPPTNAAFEQLSEEALAEINENPNKRREVILYHIGQGRYGSGEIRSWGEGEIITALGNKIVTAPSATILLNHTASVVRSDVESSNGVIHFIDGVLDPNSLSTPEPPPPAPVPEDTSAPAPEGTPDPNNPEGVQPTGEASVEQEPTSGPPTPVPTATPIPTPTKPPWWVDPAEPSEDIVTEPNENPAFVDGGYIEYYNGILADKSFCKGMTFVVLHQFNGVTQVGADRRTNPYRGDSSCEQMHPLLCMNQDFRGAPSADYLEGWSGSVVEATVPIPGTRLRSQEIADNICKNTFGHQYRLAEFHDGNAGLNIGPISGWKFWAYGALDAGTRFWVRINDQAANPWDSIQHPDPIKLNTWVDQVLWYGGDPAFVGSGGHMMPSEGLQAVRDTCKGMTFVIGKQMHGLVQISADKITNPYRGDTDCDQRLPILCIRVDGHQPPANADGNNYSFGWSGGTVNTTYPQSGHSINTREKANNMCKSAFGSGWRVVEFHDGQFGTAGTDGWRLWAYGGLNTGRRFWAINNDQPANPWNPHQ